jgi:HK97 family phage prohead protease
MGFWDFVGRLTNTPVPMATFAAETTPKPVDQFIMEMMGQSRAVTRDEALTVPTVQRGRNLICSISTLPLQERGPDLTVLKTPLLRQIDPNVPNVVTLAQTLEDLLFESIAWWQITARDADGFPVKARRRDPTTVSLVPPNDGKSRAPLPSGTDPRDGVVWVDGKPVPHRDMIRFDSPNPAVLKVGGLAIRKALLLLKTSHLAAQDARARDYFTTKEGFEEPTDADIQEFLSQWKDARRRRTTGWVPENVEHNVVEDPTPLEMQIAEQLKESKLDIANALGIDPEDLGISTTSRTYQNAVDRRIDKINEVKAPYMRAIADRLSMGDVTRPDHEVEFDLNGYLRSNPKERWEVNKIRLETGVVSKEEVRVEERMAGAPPKQEAQPAPEPAPDNVRSIRAAFEGEERHQFVFGPTGQFSVDQTSRTITGIALPYNKVSRMKGMRFRFRPGSVVWGDVSRVKHFKDHITPVGRALSLYSDDTALHSVLSVSKGPVGDELLQLAADGVYDGQSVGVDFSMDDVELMPDGVYDVLRNAQLYEITTTAMPAFDDARVTRVAASLTGGTMQCTKCGQEHAGAACIVPVDKPPTQPAGQPAGPAPAQFSVDQIMGFSDDQMAAFRLLYGKPEDVHKPVQPATVDPTQGGQTSVQFQVKEPAPYRFDRKGNLRKGSHDFSSDLYAAQKMGDQAAYDRALGFIREQFDVITSNVDELNPTKQRPDMYVDQRSFRYPVWESINKGALDDITPFTFPKFNSASGLVANHTEGVEPGSGTFTTTGQTVTPTAVSGKAKITREVWDQGGNPQVSNLIWQQMVKGWFESLEAFAVATLDASTPTAIPLTAGAADDVLIDQLSEAFVLLQFVRGGFSMDMMPTQVDLYKKLAAAEDSTGRPLLPALGPNNTIGTSRARWSGLDLNGTTSIPAWALAATGSVVASSYLYDRAVVHGWASAPNRLEIGTIEVAHVYIALWGYKAGAISDIAGVREITYDPVA